jgi:hypothetical protein
MRWQPDEVGAGIPHGGYRKIATTASYSQLESTLDTRRENAREIFLLVDSLQKQEDAGRAQHG